MLLLLVTIVQLLTVPTPVLSSQDSPAAPILFIINSQPGEYHAQLADTSRQSILKQWKSFVPASLMKSPQVLLTSEMDPEVSLAVLLKIFHSYSQIANFGWTIFPLIEIMKIQMESEKIIEWIALLSENTEVDLKALNAVVQTKKLRPVSESLFFGRALKDKDPTIIHHFASASDLMYPDLEAGIFLSRHLVYDLWEILMREQENLRQNKAFPGRNHPDFQIFF